jgi:hypothetical protein
VRSLFGKLRECDRSFSVSLWFVKKGCLGIEEVRSLFGEVGGSAIALSLCSLCLCGSLKKDIGKLRECDRCLGVKGMRSLFGRLRGCDRFW